MRDFARAITNNVVIVVLTIVLLFYAAVNWVGGAIFEDRYEVSVPMHDAGGLFPLQEVTVLGVGVGQIRELELTDTGVIVRTEIRGGEVVPERAVVQVLRRSTIGEQALNFVPVPADYEPPDDPEEIDPYRLPLAEGWEAADRGAQIEPVAVVLPAQIPEVLNQATRLFREIPPADLATVINELGDALDGRADLLKELNRDSLDLNETLVDAIPEFQRLIDTSRPVLAMLNEHRQALADSFTHLADVSDTLADLRPVSEAVIDNGTPFLREFDAFVVNTRENQSCLMDDFLRINRHIGTEENLRWLKQGLDLHEAFYFGADNALQFDPFRPGLAWFRVNLLLFEEANARKYEPRRPTPETRPGAACVSPWGVGVNAVRQANPQPPDPTSPGIDYAPLLERDDDDAPRHGGSRGHVTRGSAAPPGETPRTGGGAALVAPAALLAAWLLRKYQ